MPFAAVCFMGNNNAAVSNNEENLGVSLSTSLSPLSKGVKGDIDDDDCTATTSTSSYLTADENYELEACILPPLPKSVHFSLEENKVEVFEYDPEERAVMWYTPEEKEMQRQEVMNAVELLQDYADFPVEDDDDEFAIVTPAEAIANSVHNTTTRGLEHWASSHIYQESRQRLEIVRLSVLAEQQDLASSSTWSSSVEEDEEAIALVSLRTSAYAAPLAQEKARKDSRFVNEIVLGKGKSNDV